jgi:hypothetical protein
MCDITMKKFQRAVDDFKGNFDLLNFVFKCLLKHWVWQIIGSQFSHLNMKAKADFLAWHVLEIRVRLRIKNTLLNISFWVA